MFSRYFTFNELKRNGLLQIGLISFFLYFWISYLSRHFIYGVGYVDRPIILFLLLYLILFLFYFLAIYLVLRLNEQSKDLKIVLLFAILFRLVMLPSNPIQEDDYYRYLWDGKVTRNGINPYKYSPDEIREFAENRENIEHTYKKIKELESLNLIRFENYQSEILFDRINHPDVPTIYPPFSQIVFSFADVFLGGGIPSLRIILLIFDLAVLWMIFLLLKSQKINPLYSIIYAWSPLVIKEITNSLHMESIPLLFLTLSTYLLIKSCPRMSILTYSLSILSKYYSLMLLPIVLAEIRKDGWLKLFTAAIILLFTLLIFCFPFINNEWSMFEGLIIYGSQWERNDSIFAVIKYLTGNRQMAIIIVFGLFTVILGYVALVGENIVKKILIILAAFFLLSPTQYPWYFISFLPFLTLYPNRALLLLSGLLSLYYLEFYFIYHQFNQAILLIRWFEYLPFYILLIYDMFIKCEK
tara:strand:+ start:2073 stop:3482 length:1410 start_codon:yes stop_codon:yes gene_type:complete